jgi:hypothetical protein
MAKEAERLRDAALLRALSAPHKRQKEMKIGKRQPGSERDVLTREGVEWLAFLRSAPLSEEGGGSLARRIVLFGQSLRDLSHHDGNVGVVNQSLLDKKIK